MKIIFFLLFLFSSFSSVYLYILPQVYKEFHPIAIYNQVNINKPTTFHIGKLPLILWINKISNSNDYTTECNAVLNYCKHLGNSLERSSIHNNCLICPFHKTIHNKTDNFGTTVIKDGLIWWKYKSFSKNPPTIPIINNDDNHNNNYETINFKTDVNINFINFLLNFLYIDSNIKINYFFKNKKLFLKANKDDKTKLRIYYKYPYSIIVSNSFQGVVKMNSIFMCNMMPIGSNKTRLYITVKFKKGAVNYFINYIHSLIIRFYLAKIIHNLESSFNSNLNTNLNLNINIKKNLNNYLKDVYHSYKDYMDLFDDTTINNFLINKNFY